MGPIDCWTASAVERQQDLDELQRTSRAVSTNADVFSKGGEKLKRKKQFDLAKAKAFQAILLLFFVIIIILCIVFLVKGSKN